MSKTVRLQKQHLTIVAKNKTVAKGFRWPGAKNELGEAILSHSPIKRGRKFIDVGAGRGALTFWAWELGFDFEEWVINDPNTAEFFEALRDVGDKVRVGPRTRKEFEKQGELAAQGDPQASVAFLRPDRLPRPPRPA